MMPPEQQKDFEDLEASQTVLPDLQTRHASAKASFSGAARQRNLRLHLHWVWLRGGEKGAAVAETGSMVENLRGGGTFSRYRSAGRSKRR